jgi:hypothetical protein
MKLQSINLNENTERAAYQAIETAVIEYFQVKDCIVNLDTHSACILFDPVVHQKWIARLYGNTETYSSKNIPITIPLNRLPKKIIKSAQPILEQILGQHDALETYLKWRARERGIARGTITEEFRSHFKVSLKGAVAIFDRKDGIKTEQYVLGETYLFQIKRVRMHMDNVYIHLSRRSKKIPEQLLKHKFPKYDFKCYRRIPGTKSWIKTTAPRYKWGLLISKEIRKTLAWEYLQFYDR